MKYMTKSTSSNWHAGPVLATMTSLMLRQHQDTIRQVTRMLQVHSIITTIIIINVDIIIIVFIELLKHRQDTTDDLQPSPTTPGHSSWSITAWPLMYLPASHTPPGS